MSTDPLINLPVLQHRVVNGTVGEQAHLLLAQGRLWLPPVGDFAIVFGRSAAYRVQFYARGTSCSCPHGRRMSSMCSHATAALIAISEREHKPLTFPAQPGDQLELLEVVS